MSLPTSLRAPLRALDEALLPRRLFRARKADGRTERPTHTKEQNMQFQGTANNVEIIGWLGADPEQRFIPNGAAVTSFSVATKRPSHSGGEPKTEWIPVEAWERLAEVIARHLHKGSRVRVTGMLIIRSWEDRETGQRRSRRSSAPRTSCSSTPGSCSIRTKPRRPWRSRTICRSSGAAGVGHGASPRIPYRTVRLRRLAGSCLRCSGRCVVACIAHRLLRQLRGRGQSAARAVFPSVPVGGLPRQR
jgi:single-strand DNA-binding protein